MQLKMRIAFIDNLELYQQNVRKEKEKKKLKFESLEKFRKKYY